MKFESCRLQQTNHVCDFWLLDSWKSKTYFSKLWFNDDLPWYKVKITLNKQEHIPPWMSRHPNNLRVATFPPHTMEQSLVFGLLWDCMQMLSNVDVLMTDSSRYYQQTGSFCHVGLGWSRKCSKHIPDMVMFHIVSWWKAKKNKHLFNTQIQGKPAKRGPRTFRLLETIISRFLSDFSLRCATGCPKCIIDGK